MKRQTRSSSSSRGTARPWPTGGLIPSQSTSGVSAIKPGDHCSAPVPPAARKSWRRARLMLLRQYPATSRKVRHGVTSTGLFTVTSQPIGRGAQGLHRRGRAHRAAGRADLDQAAHADSTCLVFAVSAAGLPHDSATFAPSGKAPGLVRAATHIAGIWSGFGGGDGVLHGVQRRRWRRPISPGSSSSTCWRRWASRTVRASCSNDSATQVRAVRTAGGASRSGRVQ